MNKNLRIIFLIVHTLGYLILSFSSIFRNSLSDFTLGFCEGISIVFIVTGFVYMVWCFIKRINPYKI